ncbi:hypothetical protein JMN32_07335 [Fulvivirga sp. 29W222]|uniref:DUF4861 domain-containing protein n=1 Tax=Fulvivirga marina TaxID=2494733 RepID=A0A937FUB1_9BACT|nr:hypothetical protein [Fulvivirga marina]MBL6446114.1 hypothetical protein [Fulvivirga marina]
MLKSQLIFLLTFFFYLSSFAQDDVSIIKTLDSLQYGAELPKDILQNKSVALVQIPPKGTTPMVRGDWKKLSELTQPGFKKAGIDVVTYYHVEDIYSGKESYLAFMEEFKKRELENVVFIVQKNGTYRIVLTKVNDEKQLIKAEQPAWQTQNTDLSIALDNLYKATASSSQDRDNLLILEVPEFGEMAKTIDGRRGEYYDLNFSSEKLAIPIFADTSKINAVMTNYPYKFGFVNPDLEEKKVRADGHQYILYYVHSTGKSVKEMLEYTITDTETAYVSEVVRDDQATIHSYSINTPVYKFYIKHIYSGNVFLGKKWDAAPTWEEALSNYISNLRTELIRN